MRGRVALLGGLSLFLLALGAPSVGASSLVTVTKLKSSALGQAAIAAGGTHNCAVTSVGALKCWGDNFYGQLGNGTTTASNVPVDVSGLASGVVAIAAGAGHSCAVTSAGAAKCWGHNFHGQLGNGTTTDSNVPVDVSGLASGVVALTGSASHSCGATSGGAAKCWGFNKYGQLGNGTNTNSNVPVDVSGLASGVAAIAAGTFYSCAVTSGGAAQCWGLNNYGQLGNGTNTNSNVPVDVSGLASGVVAITAGADDAGGGGHSCAVTSAGAVKCWGSDAFGQLGNGTTTDSNVPVDVSGLASGVVAIAAGADHSCAVTSAGAVKCWGHNSYGQLGNGTTRDSHVPVDVSGLASGVVAVAAGAEHSCAVTSAGAVECWGHNFYGQLGNGTTTDSNVPVYVKLALAQTLTVSKSGTGSGSVTSSPAGISCGATCSHQFASGTAVTLTAMATSGSTFGGWSGACSGTGSCVVTTNSATTSVTASFSLTPKPKPCVVPKVKGKSLKSAKRAIKAHHCSVGKVKHSFSTRVQKGRVISQKPKPGRRLRRGGRVNLVISKGKH